MSMEKNISKFANETTANSLDASSDTSDQAFARALIIAQPPARLEEEGVIEVRQVDAGTDKVVFTVIPESSFTWRTIDTRGSEDVSTAATLSSISAPTFKTATPTTKSATIFIHDSVSLVNPVSFEDIAMIAGMQVKQKKIADAITELTTESFYDDLTSIRNANGFNGPANTASDDTLTPTDLVKAVEFLKKKSSPVVPDVCILHTTQIRQLETHGDFAPGNTSNANFKKARFDQNGNLVAFAGLQLIEVLEAEAPQKTTSPFASAAGHYAIIGQKRLMLGRAENNAKNTVEDFRNPEEHGTRRTLNVNYDYVIKHPASIVLLRCAD